MTLISKNIGIMCFPSFVKFVKDLEILYFLYLKFSPVMFKRSLNCSKMMIFIWGTRLNIRLLSFGSTSRVLASWAGTMCASPDVDCTPVQ